MYEAILLAVVSFPFGLLSGKQSVWSLLTCQDKQQLFANTPPVMMHQLADTPG